MAPQANLSTQHCMYVKTFKLHFTGISGRETETKGSGQDSFKRGGPAFQTLFYCHQHLSSLQF